MAALLDLGPAAEQLVVLVDGVDPGQLARPTPCDRFAVADLLDHCRDAANNLAAAANEAVGRTVEPVGAADGGDTDRVKEAIRRLAQAWADPALVEVETTKTGGTAMPVHFHNMIATQELVVHGWDLAVATGQPFDPDPETVVALYEFLVDELKDAPRDGSGPFGPAEPVDESAPVLERVLGFSGRDPRWAPQH